MRDMQEARDKVADALWWMRGFAASSTSVVHVDLTDKLTEVNSYLQKVQNGQVRRLGDETAVVMTFAEFERLVDAVRVPRPEEIKIAIDTINSVLADYTREDRRRNQDQPF